MKMHNIDIFGVAESWTHELIKDEEISLPGYVMFRKDRDESKRKKRGGGCYFMFVIA
jgi:hypothetical protein